MASYRVEVAEEAKREIRRLPGNIRQRVMRVLRALQQEPRPQESQALDTTEDSIDLPPGIEVCRIRLASWRIIYLIEDERLVMTVLAIRKRPPYQYDDLAELIKNL
jgi:mRNA interferase RelE/StbE